MKANKILSVAFAGMLALFATSCREDNGRNDRYDDDRTIGNDRMGDGKIGDDELGDGKIGDDKLGDGKIGDGRDDNYREASYSSSMSSKRSLIIGEDGDKIWKVRQDLNTTGADEMYDRRGEFHFYSSNGFTLSSPDGSENGSWSFDGTNLNLRYQGEGKVYSYRVTELTEDRMTLRASDGSELTLVDKDIK